MSDEKAHSYRQAVSKAFTEHFGTVEVKSASAAKCVSNVQCVAGDICYQGACQGYSEAMEKIKASHEEYLAKKQAAAAAKSIN